MNPLSRWVMRRSMLKAGAVEKPCPHCGRRAAQYEDGLTRCLWCDGEVGVAREVGGHWEAQGDGSVELAEKFDVRPYESVSLPAIKVEMRPSQQGPVVG